MNHPHFVIDFDTLFFTEEALVRGIKIAVRVELII
jgi:hypothetical protein